MHHVTKRTINPLILTIATFLSLAIFNPNPIYAQTKGQNETTVSSSPPQNTPQDCSVSFSDVQPSDQYYTAIHYLACRGVLGGYPDGTFRPGVTATRGQLAKIEVLAKGWPLLTPPVPSFSDVPRSHAFYSYIETAKAHNVLGGYGDGNYRPGNEITRGQLSKIVVTAEGWPLLTPTTPSFPDVLPGSPFYSYVETAVAHGAIGGYANGTFLPGNAARRGQIAKIVYNATAFRLTPEEQETVDLINSRRAVLGLPTLRVDIPLVMAARRHSNDIGPRGLCQHTGTDGSSPWDRIAQAGYAGQGRGEVVGCNYDTPAAVVQSWWNSPGHYAVLTGNDIEDIGCGWWYTGQGTGWQTCVTGSSR